MVGYDVRHLCQLNRGQAHTTRRTQHEDKLPSTEVRADLGRQQKKTRYTACN